MNLKINENYWMKIVDDIATASTCRKSLGCVLVKNNYCVGMGYVGSVTGDTHCDASITNTCLLVKNNNTYGSGDKTSCIRTIHAEMNAILNMPLIVRGTVDSWISCYSTYQPCLNCLKALLQIGVRNFVYKFSYLDINRDTYIVNLSTQVLTNFKMYAIPI